MQSVIHIELNRNTMRQVIQITLFENVIAQDDKATW